MNQQQYIKHIEGIFNTCLAIIKKKNSDYSKVEDPFYNFREMAEAGSLYYRMTVEEALMSMMGHKISRVKTILRKKDIQVKDEGLDDTFLDLINYIAILKTYIDKDEQFRKLRKT